MRSRVADQRLEALSGGLRSRSISMYARDSTRRSVSACQDKAHINRQVLVHNIYVYAHDSTRSVRLLNERSEKLSE